MHPRRPTPNHPFLSKCPRKLKLYPLHNCPKGTPVGSPNPEKVREEPQCEWWINSEKHKYCFWNFIREESDDDGSMPERVQSELAQLFGYSNTKIHFTLKQALEELGEALRQNEAEELLLES